jgi:flagellar M-ring protein FliF
MPTSINSLRDTWRNVEPRGQLTLVISFLLIAITGYFLWSYATAPSYTAIQTNLNPADTNRVTQALASAGVTYKVVNGGTEVDVLSSQQSKAQVALASKGVGPGNHASLGDMSSLGLGATDFQQQVAYQRGLEGDIATQIEGIDGVTSAQVQLVLPQDTLFQDQASASRASVLITDNGALAASTVAGIAHMVSSSVQGLDPQNVTVTDNLGQLLWPDAAAGGAGITGASKIAQEQSYDAQMAADINMMLAQTLGPGKAEARVNAQLNLNQVTNDSVTYDGKSVPLTVQKDDEKLNGSGAGGNGVAGTGGNIPPVYQAGNGGNAAGAGSNYTHQSGTTNYGANKVISHEVVAPGAVEQQSVALLFDKSVPPTAITAIKNTVAGMVGLQPSRGDAITTASVPFTKTTAAGAASAGPLGVPLSIATIVKYVLGGLGTAVFLFLVRRNLKRREGEARHPEPTWLREISGTTPIAALEGPQPERITPAHVKQREKAHREAEEIVKKQPEHVAMQVQQWMNES